MGIDRHTEIKPDKEVVETHHLHHPHHLKFLIIKKLLSFLMLDYLLEDAKVASLEVQLLLMYQWFHINILTYLKTHMHIMSLNIIMQGKLLLKEIMENIYADVMDVLLGHQHRM